MFGNICMQYYLDEDTYNKLSEKFGLTKGNQKKQFSNNPIIEISLLDIVYESFGHTHFFWVTVDVNLLYGMEKGSFIPMDKVDCDSFSKLLTQAYKKTFGDEIENGIRKREYHYCTYVEYMAFVKTEDADALMYKLERGNFSDEQLAINCFDSYRLKNAYITFTVNKLDKEVIRLCAKIPGTALKRIFKVNSDLVEGHIPHTTIDKVLDKEKAAEILYRQVVKYTKPDVPHELSQKIIYAAL